MPGFNRALVEIAPDEELQTAADWLVGQGMPVARFYEKKMRRGHLDLDRETLVIGRMPSMVAAMRLLSIPRPDPIDYPRGLQEALGRRVWRSRLGVARQSTVPVFVKPAQKAKRFAGRVLSPGDGVPGVSGSTEVWCSEVVRWESEHRCFVIDGAVVDCRRYAGAGDIALTAAAGWAAAHAHRGAPRGYAIDCGRLSDGTTAVVECNDGFALGRYGADVGAYVQLLTVRWAELLGVG